VEKFTNDDGNELIFRNFVFAKRNWSCRGKKTRNVYDTELIQQQGYKYSYVRDGENFHPDSCDRMLTYRLLVTISDEAESGHTSFEGSLPQGFKPAI